MSYARNVDANQVAVVAALRAAGASVLHLHEVGRGCPDLLVGIAGRDALVEVKDGAKIPSKQQLNADQVAWHRQWRGRPVAIITSASQAMDFARSLAAEVAR